MRENRRAINIRCGKMRSLRYLPYSRMSIKDRLPALHIRLGCSWPDGPERYAERSCRQTHTGFDQMTVTTRTRFRKSYILARVQVELFWPTWLWLCGNMIDVLSVHKKRPPVLQEAAKSDWTEVWIQQMELWHCHAELYDQWFFLTWWKLDKQSWGISQYDCTLLFYWAVVHFDKNLCMCVQYMYK